MFKDIDRYKGKYQINENGDVKSLNYRGNTKKEKILKPILRNGYVYVELYGLDGKSRKESIHRLVAETFIENPNNLPCVNHIDENKTNNNVSNLAWCTHKENSNHGTSPQRLSENAKKHQTWKIAVESSKLKVDQFNLQGDLLKTWDCLADAARDLKVTNATNIVSCCKGKRSTAYGYKWKYHD